jgi:MFS family permease
MPAASASVSLFLTFTAGYFLSYFLRSANAVLAPDLQRDVGLGPADLGLMTSLFFAAYAAAQVPVGVALDRWGPRGVAVSLMSLGVAGALLFAVGTSLPTLALGRVLLGIGTGSVLLAGLKAFALWWPAHRFATVSGVYFAAGSLGALLASSPLAWANAAFGWRSTFVAAAAVVAAVTVLVWLRTPPAARRAPASGPGTDRDPRPDEAAGTGTDREALRSGGGASAGAVRARPAAGAAPAAAPLPRGTLWALASVMLIGAAHTGPVLAFQTLWGGPYLYGGYGVDAATAGRFLLTLSLGVSIGYATSGAMADRFGLRLVTFLAGVAFALVQLALAAVEPGVTDLAWVWPLYALLGFTGGYCVLALSNARALLGVTRSGRATGIVNGASIGGVFAMQWGFGLIVEAVGGPDGFRLALLGTGSLTLVAAVLHAWARSRADRAPMPAAAVPTGGRVGEAGTDQAPPRLREAGDGRVDVVEEADDRGEAGEIEHLVHGRLHGAQPHVAPRRAGLLDGREEGA